MPIQISCEHISTSLVKLIIKGDNASANFRRQHEVAGDIVFRVGRPLAFERRPLSVAGRVEHRPGVVRVRDDLRDLFGRLNQAVELIGQEPAQRGAGEATDVEALGTGRAYEQAG